MDGRRQTLNSLSQAWKPMHTNSLDDRTLNWYAYHTCEVSPHSSLSLRVHPSESKTYVPKFYNIFPLFPRSP